MPENPYAPPTSEVADVEADMDSMERPRIVSQGIGLLWAYLAIGISQVILEGFVAPASIEDDPEGALRKFQSIATVVSLAVLAVMALLTWFAWKGRNWARITHLVLVIIGMLTYGAALVAAYWLAPEEKLFDEDWYLNVLFALETVLNMAGVLLLFTPSANAWYRAMRAARILRTTRAEGHFTG